MYFCYSPATASAESDLDSILCDSVGGVVAIHEALSLVQMFVVCFIRTLSTALARD